MITKNARGVLRLSYRWCSSRVARRRRQRRRRCRYSRYLDDNHKRQGSLRMKYLCRRHSRRCRCRWWKWRPRCTRFALPCPGVLLHTAVCWADALPAPRASMVSRAMMHINGCVPIGGARQEREEECLSSLHSRYPGLFSPLSCSPGATVAFRFSSLISLFPLLFCAFNRVFCFWPSSCPARVPRGSGGLPPVSARCDQRRSVPFLVAALPVS